MQPFSPLFFFFTVSFPLIQTFQPCCKPTKMGLFTFGKKINPSKAAATKNQQPAKSSKKHDVATAPERLPANELKVLELAVGDKNLSLDIKSQATETSLMDDILGELSEQSHGENKWQPQGISFFCFFSISFE
jgi:hypothetical protein